MRPTIKCLLVLFMVNFCTGLVAQDFYPSQRSFEKTRIQYQKFVWHFFSSQNFEVYYFSKNENLARTTIQFAESDFQKITQLLSYTPFQKTKIFVYPSQSELLQSNSGISLNSPNEVESENLSKFRFEISFSEDLSNFRKNLVKEISKVYVHDMLYGGSIRDVLQNSLLLSLPEWYLSGISAFVAFGDSPEMNQYMYQVVSSNKVRKPSLARGKEAELLGQSIWNYIAKTYGKQPVGNILNLTRIIRNDQSSISSTLRRPYAKFLKEWYEFYLSESKQYEVNTVSTLAPTELIQKELNRGEVLRDFKVSSDGIWLAYVIDESGKYQINLMNLKTKKTNEIFKTGLKDPLRISNGRGPLVYWSKTNSLSILYQNEGKSWLQTFSPLTDKRNSIRMEAKKSLGDWQFLDFELSSNAQRMLARTLRNGQVDVGIYDLKRNRFSPITQDIYDESEAHWVGNTGDVFYVSDRYEDTLQNILVKEGIKSLYKWKADEPSKVQRVFSHKGEYFNVRAISDSLIYLLVKQYSGNELVAYHINSDTFSFTPIRAGTWDRFDWVKDKIVFKSRDNLTDKLQFLPTDVVTKLQTSLWVPTLDNNPNSDLTFQDSVVDSSLNQNLSARDRRNAELKRARLERQASLRLRKEPGKLMGPIEYQNSFVINNSEGSFRVDPVRGLGYSFEVKMNDLLENHLVRTGIFVTSNLKNTDLWGEYAYLAKKIDWFARFDRKVLDQLTETYSQKIRFNRFEVKAVYPFDLSNKISLSGIFTSNRAFDQYNLATPEDLATYGGVKLEYTFDNTIHWAENLRTGFRMNASLENQLGLTKGLGFTRFKLDARKYIKLSNTFFIASRISASHALGGAARQTILGGMDNWLFINTESRNKENPLGMQGIAQRDVFMSDFATSLRGFNMNKLSGNSHLLVNLELRIPLKSLLSSDFSKSRFINSFQFIGFTDIGSAWTGTNPFSRTNGFNTNVYGGGTNPFQATVTDFRNPFLFGYGVGARASLLGYFMKFDYAFGVDNGEVKTPITYLTFGYDF